MVGVLGTGRMGAAIVAGLIEKGVCRPPEVAVFDREGDRVRELAARFPVVCPESAAALVSLSDTLVLAVKPQDRETAADALRRAFSPDRETLVISILAGVSTGWLEGRLDGRPVVRVMPNLGIRAGVGLSFFSAGRHAGDVHRESVRRLFGALGETREIGEGLMDAVTALSGSGPAYFFLLMEMMADFAAASGIERSDAREMAAAAALSAALLARGHDPVPLKREVASPGGTTEAALDFLEKGGVRQLFAGALGAAVARSRALAGEE